MQQEDRQASARDEFIEAAVRLIDANGPNPSMDDIAREAGATKPRLYRQFADKADLYAAIAQRSTDEVYNAVAPNFNFFLMTPTDALEQAVTAYASAVAEHPNVFRFLLQSPHKHDAQGSPLSLEMERDLARRLADVARGIFETVSIDTSELDFIARSAVGVLVSTTDLWLTAAEPDQGPDVAPYVRQASEVVWSLLNAYLDRLGFGLDPTEPLFMALARMKGALD